MSRLAYIIGTFPALTETFVAREIQALEATGAEIELFSLRRPPAGHERAEGTELVERTCYGSALSGRDLWAANGRALRRAPACYAAALGAVLVHTALNPVHAIKSLALFPVAVAFAERMRARGVTHVHAHWANYPATAAYVVSRLLGIPYSFTAHAHDAALIRSMMREKIRRAAFVMTCTRWSRNIHQLVDIFAAGGADGRRAAGIPDGGSPRATDREGPVSRPSRTASVAGHSMGNDRPSGNARRSPGRYLTHKQAIALLEAVARLLEASETADGSHGTAMPRLVTAMHTVGIDPALIHAYQETGVLVSEGNEDLWSVNDLRRWEAALERYRSRQSPDISQLARVP